MLGLLGYLFRAELRGLERLYKKPLLRPGGALEPLLWPGGALQPLLWPCGGFCVREWRVLGLLGYLFPAELGGLLEGLEGLRPGKRQP